MNYLIFILSVIYGHIWIIMPVILIMTFNKYYIKKTLIQHEILRVISWAILAYLFTSFFYTAELFYQFTGDITGFIIWILVLIFTIVGIINFKL